MQLNFLSTVSPGNESKVTFLFYNAPDEQLGYAEPATAGERLAPGQDLPLAAVLGPTGSGKSDLALDIAETFDGEVVNCDSLQVYRHFDIGTAKLPVAERRGVPHHLIDILNPDELFTAGEFARRARQTIADISARGRLPILAGGTGFYVRALLDGLFPGPGRDDDLRARLAAREKRRPGSLHRILRRLDQAAAGKIHPNDVPKVTRALEVCLLTRRRVTELFSTGRDGLTGYRVLKLGLNPDRETLYRRLDARCLAMFDGGLAQEVEGILALGYARECKPFESHGYKQTLQLLAGELNRKEAVFYAQRNTRNYAKRQMTWFRRENNMTWLRGFGSEEAVRAAAIERVRVFLHAS
jgi:tRNA dimethylallyltransferase